MYKKRFKLWRVAKYCTGDEQLAVIPRLDERRSRGQNASVSVHNRIVTQAKADRWCKKLQSRALVEQPVLTHKFLSKEDSAFIKSFISLNDQVASEFGQWLPDFKKEPSFISVEAAELFAGVLDLSFIAFDATTILSEHLAASPDPMSWDNGGIIDILYNIFHKAFEMLQRVTKTLSGCGTVTPNMWLPLSSISHEPSILVHICRRPAPSLLSLPGEGAFENTESLAQGHEGRQFWLSPSGRCSHARSNTERSASAIFNDASRRPLDKKAQQLLAHPTSELKAAEMSILQTSSFYSALTPVKEKRPARIMMKQDQRSSINHAFPYSMSSFRISPTGDDQELQIVLRLSSSYYGTFESDRPDLTRDDTKQLRNSPFHDGMDFYNAYWLCEEFFGRLQYQSARKLVRKILGQLHAAFLHCHPTSSTVDLLHRLLLSMQTSSTEVPN